MLFAGRPEYSDAFYRWRVADVLAYMFALYVRSEKDKIRKLTERAARRAARRG